MLASAVTYVNRDCALFAQSSTLIVSNKSLDCISRDIMAIEASTHVQAVSRGWDESASLNKL